MERRSNRGDSVAWQKALDVIGYRGVWIENAGGSRSATVVVPIGEIAAGPGEIVWGFYDPDTGEASQAA